MSSPRSSRGVQSPRDMAQHTKQRTNTARYIRKAENAILKTAYLSYHTCLKNFGRSSTLLEIGRVHSFLTIPTLRGSEKIYGSADL